MIGPGVGKIDICPPLPHHPAQSLSNPISSSGPAPLSAARAEPRTLASPFVLLFLLIQLILVFPFMQIVQLPPSLLLGSTVASPLVFFSCNCSFISISTSASSSHYTDIFFLHLQILFCLFTNQLLNKCTFSRGKTNENRSDI